MTLDLTPEQQAELAAEIVSDLHEQVQFYGPDRRRDNNGVLTQVEEVLLRTLARLAVVPPEQPN